MGYEYVSRGVVSLGRGRVIREYAMRGVASGHGGTGGGCCWVTAGGLRGRPGIRLRDGHVTGAEAGDGGAGVGE